MQALALPGLCNLNNSKCATVEDSDRKGWQVRKGFGLKWLDQLMPYESVVVEREQQKHGPRNRSNEIANVVKSPTIDSFFPSG